jgi:hypothetical protein
LKVSTVAGSQARMTGVTSQRGFSRRRRAASSSTLGLPTFFVVACNCLLTLVIQITSLSTRVMAPRPERTRASAVQEPTPPMPKTAALDAPR